MRSEPRRFSGSCYWSKDVQKFPLPVRGEDEFEIFQVLGFGSRRFQELCKHYAAAGEWANTTNQESIDIIGQTSN